MSFSNLNGSQESLNPSNSAGWRPISYINDRRDSKRMSMASNNPLESDVASTIDNGPPPVLERVQNAPHSFKCPVAPEVLKHCDSDKRLIDEFRYLTYTPVLCEPEEFVHAEFKYSLRQQRMKRTTELLIAVTMYNESEEFLIRTLSAIFKNIRYFCELRSKRKGSNPDGVLVGKLNDETFVASRHRDPEMGHRQRGDVIWNEDAWQKIVLVIISDGRKKIHPRVMKMLQIMGVFQPEIILQESTDPLDEYAADEKLPVTAHLFEYTCQAYLDEDLSVKSGRRNGVFPVQVLFCLKEQNKKKLNSHKWLFRAFAPLLDPYVCVLIDVGTRPKTPDSIYNLWKGFDRNSNIAGSCGEITVMMGKNCESFSNLLSPLIAAQNFEYKIANILDKSLESCFGYISVLPGAFSAYRWDALQDVSPESGPLVQYFKGESPKPKGNVFSSNMYLAEDRILCFELVAKSEGQWLLHYCKDATAETDVPSTVHEFISQRRRWLNGTFFCQIYALFHLARFWTSNHNFFRKLALTFQFMYFAASLIFSWFAIANFYLAFYLITRQTFQNGWQDLIFQVLRLAYWGIILSLFICSMGNRPQGARVIYVGSFYVLAAVMLVLSIISLMLMVKIFSGLSGARWLVEGGTATTLLISFTSTYGIYLISSILFGEWYHIVTCMFQYLLVLPSFINTIQIYAFCNTHDVSWGTKGDTKASTGIESKPKGPKTLKRNPDEPLSTEPTRLTLEELTSSFRSAMTELSTRPEEEPPKLDANTKREDYYRNFRTWFVLFWVVSNGLLIAVVSSPIVSDNLTGVRGVGNSNDNPYLAIIMYSVTCFSFIRFVGCCYYLFLRYIRNY